MRAPSHKGFTLIELAAASAIAVVLMGGVLAVMTGISRDRVRLAATQPAEAADQSALVDVFRRDLAAAIEVQVNQRDLLVIETCHALDGQDWRPVDRPCVVIYRIAQDHDFCWLIRQQRFSDDEISPRPNRTLIAFNVKHFEVRPLFDGPQGDLSSSVTEPNPKELSRRMRVKIVFDKKRANIDQVVCLR